MAMEPNLKDAYGKAKQILEMKKRNPRLKEMGNPQLVKTMLRKKGETGSPEPVDKQTKEKNDQAVRDMLEARGVLNLPRASEKLPSVDLGAPIDATPKLPKEATPPLTKEGGGPEEDREDLQEISGQLKKASKLHGNQSKRVGKIAQGIKSEVGNPYMKRSKSKYGM